MQHQAYLSALESTMGGVTYHSSPEEFYARLPLFTLDELEFLVAEFAIDDTMDATPAQRFSCRQTAKSIRAYLIDRHNRAASVNAVLHKLRKDPVSLSSAVSTYDDPDWDYTSTDVDRVLHALVSYYRTLSPKMRRVWLDGACTEPDDEFDPQSAPYWFDVLRHAAGPDPDHVSYYYRNE